MLTMNFTEDTKSHLPLYRQLAEHFKKEIRLKPSERWCQAAFNPQTGCRSESQPYNSRNCI